MLRKYLMGMVILISTMGLAGCQMNSSAGMQTTTTCCKYYTTQQSTQVRSCTSCSQYHPVNSCGNGSSCGKSYSNGCNGSSCGRNYSNGCNGSSCGNNYNNTCYGSACSVKYSCPNVNEYRTDDIGYYGYSDDCYYDQCNRYRCYR